MDALTSALASIEINANAFAARRQRIASDRRIVALKAYIAATDSRITASGVGGARQVFVSLYGAENIKTLRAWALIEARQFQIDGYRKGVTVKLARAAELRRQLADFNRTIGRAA